MWPFETIAVVEREARPLTVQEQFAEIHGRWQEAEREFQASDVRLRAHDLVRPHLITAINAARQKANTLMSERAKLLSKIRGEEKHNA